ncbi:hypothetical protein [Ferruginibacter sp.]
MKQTLLIIFLFAFLVPAFSQQDSLLKTFKFRNSNYRAVNFSAGGSSSYDRTEFGAGPRKTAYGSGGASVNYFTAKSTDRILYSASAGVGGNFSSGTSKDAGGKDKSNAYSFSPQVDILNKWFHKKFFTELGATGYGEAYGSKYTTAANTVQKNSQHQYQLLLHTGIGIGRLENVTDMQNALWLAKSLQQEKSLSRSLSAEELNGLGRSITMANNTRVLDGRRRTRFILQTVDDYLQQKGLVSKTDINYFSNLNDILFFAYNIPRLSGTEKFIRFTPGIYDYKSEGTQNNNADKHQVLSTVGSLLFSVGLNKYIPTSLVHQNNYGVALYANYNGIDYTDRYYTGGVISMQSKSSPDLKQAGVDLFYEHAIYPNTRTTINFNLQTKAGYQDANDQTNWFGEAYAAATWNYFISYRTRFQATAGGMYRKNIYQVINYLELLPNNFSLYANCGITVSI